MSDLASIYTFGKVLLETNDLDPLYVALWEAKMEPVKLRRWLLAFWCFYHAGTSSWIADVREKDEEAYWSRMRTAAASKDYPRNHERRHFRGENARKSVEYLHCRGVDDLFGPLFVNPDNVYPVSGVMEYVQKWVGFGPWIAFKVADMLERLAIVQISFDDGAALLFDSPRESAQLLWSETYPAREEPSDVGRWAVGMVTLKLRNLSAPPRYERPINAQEAETILCKWKSYRGGHYELGEDIVGLREGLLRFAKCRTSQELLAAGRKGGLWER